MSRISQIDILDYQHPQPMPDDTIIRYTLDAGWIEVRHKGTYLEITSGGSTSAIRLLVQPWVSNKIHLSLEPEPWPAPRLPLTDEEVNMVWQEYGPGVGRALAGLYATYRARGKSVEDAYEQTLQAHLEAMTSPKPRQAPHVLP